MTVKTLRKEAIFEDIGRARMAAHQLRHTVAKGTPSRAPASSMQRPKKSGWSQSSAAT